MGKKSTVVQTGLGDDQYKSLSDNQANIAGGINNLDAKATEGFNTITANQQTIVDGQGTLREGQGELWEQAEINASEIKANDNRNTTALKEGQGSILTAVQNIPSVDLSGVESKLGTLDSSVNTGFNNMGTRFDSVDSQLGTISGEVTGLGTKIDTGFEGVNSNVTSGFETAETNADARAAEAQAQRDALQEAVLTGQVGITELVNKYGEAGATYYEALAGGQKALTEQVGGVQDGLSAFQDQYTTDFETQAQFLGDLAGTVEGGFDAVRSGQTQMSDSVANQLQSAVTPQQTAAQQAAAQQLQFNSQMQQQLAQINASIAAGQIDYSQIAKQVTMGQSSGNPQVDAAAQQEWNSSLNTIRQLLKDQTINLDDRLRSNYTQLSSSFDAQGKLISSSVDANGVNTARAIDENGNLLIAQFDATGQQLMQNSLDINAMMYALKQSFSGGANYSMGNLSPANNRRFGLMSPYTQTGQAFYRARGN